MSDAKGARVLVVEDDETIGALLLDLLLDEGYEVRWARHGQQGLDALAAWPADVIVLDLMMPVLDGHGFRRAQRALPDRRAQVPVIVLSGARDARTAAAQLGAVAAISKPFDLEEVSHTIAGAVRESQRT